ncbi:hypothetical protein CALVIDRAFT_543360 [Calocera viscosa TUFC12733]|uniref:Uncharacterized protein n=1 Tax=Calocera viscosa (strain TUFC12733) TaxID=1330018 RepID=A0A167FPD1_CALVF|nr:hypothetical protein CALVIDRAFT_543360 [Calocera viscosa TUFC12733]
MLPLIGLSSLIPNPSSWSRSQSHSQASTSLASPTPTPTPTPAQLHFQLPDQLAARCGFCLLITAFFHTLLPRPHHLQRGAEIPLVPGRTPCGASFLLASLSTDARSLILTNIFR